MGWLGCAIAGAEREFWVVFGGTMTGNLVRSSFETNSMASEELPLPLQCQASTLALVETPTCHTWLSGGRDGALCGASLRASSSGETACNAIVACSHCSVPVPVLKGAKVQMHSCMRLCKFIVKRVSQRTQCAFCCSCQCVHVQLVCLICMFKVGVVLPRPRPGLPQNVPGLLRSGAWVGAARHGAPITAVAASSDGAFLFSGAADGSLFAHVRCHHIDGRAHVITCRMMRWYAIQHDNRCADLSVLCMPKT